MYTSFLKLLRNKTPDFPSHPDKRLVDFTIEYTWHKIIQYSDHTTLGTESHFDRWQMCFSSKPRQMASSVYNIQHIQHLQFIHHGLCVHCNIRSRLSKCNCERSHENIIRSTISVDLFSSIIDVCNICLTTEDQNCTLVYPCQVLNI